MSVLYLSMQCWCRPLTTRCHPASVWAEALLCPSGAAQLSSAGPGLLLGRTRSCGWRSIDVKAALLSPGWAALYSPLLYRHSTLYTALLPAATASACHLNWLHNITGCTSVLQYFTTLHLTLWNWQTKEVNLETMVKLCFGVSCDLLKIAPSVCHQPDAYESGALIYLIFSDWFEQFYINRKLLHRECCIAEIAKLPPHHPELLLHLHDILFNWLIFDLVRQAGNIN